MQEKHTIPIGKSIRYSEQLMHLFMHFLQVHNQQAGTYL